MTVVPFAPQMDEGNRYLKKRSVAIIGAPIAKGQNHSGVSTAPDMLRNAGLHKVIKGQLWEITDMGNSDKQNGEANLNLPSESKRPLLNSDYTEEDIPKCISLGASCEELYQAVRSAAASRQFVLTIGGDHSIAAATIGGMLNIHPDLCVIWVDAHGDINTPETSPSKSYHGMPVAHLLGWFKANTPGFDWMNGVPILEEQRVGYLGLRDVDYHERNLINNSKVCAKSMFNIDRDGIAQCLNDVLNAIDPTGSRPIHLSFDIDACDPAIAPGTGTRARGGLSYREAHYICETLYATRRLVSMDLVEVNPVLDLKDEFLHGDDPCIDEDATKTVRLGLELIASALGKLGLSAILILTGFDLEAWTASDTTTAAVASPQVVHAAPGRGPSSREGDWPCISCGNVNFSKRTKCNKCGVPRPGTETDAAKDPLDDVPHFTGPPGLFKRGDWPCTHCGNVNWARRPKCNVCNASKPTTTESPRTGRGGGHFDLQDPQDKQHHLSDDEEYDEFGRKKKRREEKKFRPPSMPLESSATILMEPPLATTQIKLHFPLPPRCYINGRSRSMSSTSSRTSDYTEPEAET